SGGAKRRLQPRRRHRRLGARRISHRARLKQERPDMRPTLAAIVVLGFPSIALATTPTITNVSGTVQAGQTLIITGTSMVQEDQSSWVSFFQNHPDASGFEGAGILSSMG